MVRYDNSARALAIGLALLAGFVDAVGFLLTGGLFVSFMSGNSTRLAVDLAGAGAIAGLAGMIIAGFVAGVVLGSLTGARWPNMRAPGVLALVSALLALGAMLTWGGSERLPLIPVTMAMGCANTIFQRGGDVTIGVTYMTGALVRMGQRLADMLRGGNRWDWLPFLLLWTGLAGGAIIGALAFGLIGVQSLWIAATAAGLLALWACRLEL